MAGRLGGIRRRTFAMAGHRGLRWSNVRRSRPRRPSQQTIAAAAPCSCSYPSSRPLCSSAGAAAAPREPATTIVFDKDGTLLDAHKLWGPIVRAACHLMQEPDDALFQLLGYDSATESFTPTSIFLIEPNSIVHKRLCDAGVDADLFYERVCPQPTPSAPIVNCEELFARCRAAGLHVAVLTSDDRQSTLNFLEQERVEPDALHCGDDGRGHKPSAEPLLALASVQRTPFFPPWCSFLYMKDDDRMPRQARDRRLKVGQQWRCFCRTSV